MGPLMYRTPLAETIVKSCSEKWLSLQLLQLIAQYSLFLNLEMLMALHNAIGAMTHLFRTQHHFAEITPSIPIATTTDFVLTDLATIFCSVPSSTALATICLHLRMGHSTTFPGYQWDISAPLPLHIVFAGSILIASTFLQKHRYDIILMTSSSEEIFHTFIGYIHIQKNHRSG